MSSNGGLSSFSIRRHGEPLVRRERGHESPQHQMGRLAFVVFIHGSRSLKPMKNLVEEALDFVETWSIRHHFLSATFLELLQVSQGF